MIAVVVLAVDKKSACVKKNLTCRFCSAQRDYYHMLAAHPEIVERHRLNMRNEFDKEIAGSQDRVQYQPRWHTKGNRL